MHYRKSIIVPMAVWLTCVCAQIIDLGSAASYAVLGSTTVTSTGNTILQGNLAISPGTAYTGFPPGVVTGVTSSGDAAASTVHTDAKDAYNMATSLSCGIDLTGADLGGKTLTAGVYCFSSSVGITGTLVLDAEGNPDAVFIFQIGSTLITATDAKVILINSAQRCSVTWAVGSSATLGTSTSFEGSILALISITANSGVVSSGGLYALTGATTLIDDKISAVGLCSIHSPPVHPSVSIIPSSPPSISIHQITTSTITVTSFNTGTVTVTTIPTGMITRITPSCKASVTVTSTLSASATCEPPKCKIATVTATMEVSGKFIKTTTVTDTWTTTKIMTTIITRAKTETVTVKRPTTVQITRTKISTTTATVTKTRNSDS